ncbi:F-box protein [Panicum miliaceum]|uniref:F-box protein n=1 Tax=Panicum miliaceum TaxID=4540 RepID=A0A3L6TT17_PANMI|nr:F-box protein [Panicum miliaceum]
MALLPEDVLARLAPRALAVSRAVCREWRAVADARCRLRADLLPVSLGGIFVRTNEAETPAFFVQPSMAHRIAGDLDYYLETDPCQRYCYTPDIVDCCNGLLLLEDHVINPATRQWVRLPPYPALPEQKGTQGSRGHYYRFLAFDPTSSPHYEVLAMEGPPYCKDKLPEGLAWPPSVSMLLIYSSSTGRWEERPFVRKGPAITITNNLWPASDLGDTDAVYWHGALYVYWNEFSMR